MNILFGLVLMAILLSTQEIPYFASTTIESFHEKSVSAQNGLKVGDTIVSIDGYDIYTDKDFSYSLATMKTDAPDIKVKRNGEIVDLGKVKFDTTKDSSGKTYIKLDFYVVPIERNFGSIVIQTFKQTYSVIRMIWASLLGIVTGQFSMNDISGPIGATSAISEATAMGLEKSFTEGLNNLKPVPAKYEGWVHTIGFVLLILLMIVVSLNDVIRLFSGG